MSHKSPLCEPLNLRGAVLATTGTVNYAPGYRPLCGEDDELALHTQDPHQVAGCEECIELVADDLADNEYCGRCLHYRREITAQGGVAWRRIVRNPCPHCGRPGW